MLFTAGKVSLAMKTYGLTTFNERWTRQSFRHAISPISLRTHVLKPHAFRLYAVSEPTVDWFHVLAHSCVPFLRQQAHGSLVISEDSHRLINRPSKLWKDVSYLYREPTCRNSCLYFCCTERRVGLKFAAPCYSCTMQHDDISC